MTTGDLALSFARRLRANADHAERSKFSVCNLSTLKIEEARALADILEAAHARKARAQEPVAAEELKERVAKLLWERFAPAHHMEWEGETHKAEYRSVAGDVLAMLAAAPVSPAAEPYLGWLYHNEDTGTEWSEQHPVESGEVPDATDVRAATLENLKAEMVEAWQVLSEMREERVSPAADSGAARRQVTEDEHEILNGALRRASDANAALAAYTPAPQPGVAVKVKALGWAKTKNNKDWGANSPVGAYYAGNDPMAGKRCAAEALARARREGREDAAAYHDRKVAKWLKEAMKHKRRDGRSSYLEGVALERARRHEQDAAAIRTLIEHESKEE